MYYLYIDECGNVGQFNTILVGYVLSFNLKYFYKINDNYIQIKMLYKLNII